MDASPVVLGLRRGSSEEEEDFMSLLELAEMIDQRLPSKDDPLGFFNFVISSEDKEHTESLSLAGSSFSTFLEKSYGTGHCCTELT
jgi:hypothetical protein